MSKLHIVTGLETEAIYKHIYEVNPGLKVTTHAFPEAQLHPTKQVEWVYRLNLRIDTFIITHSPYILTAINNRILAHDVDKKCPAVSRVGGGIAFEDVTAVECRWDSVSEINVSTRDIRLTETRLIGDTTDHATDVLEKDFDEMLEQELLTRKTINKETK